MTQLQSLATQKKETNDSSEGLCVDNYTIDTLCLTLTYYYGTTVEQYVIVQIHLVNKSREKIKEKTPIYWVLSSIVYLLKAWYTLPNS